MTILHLNLDQTQLGTISTSGYEIRSSGLEGALHALAGWARVPIDFSLRAFAHVVEPLPGVSEERLLWGLAVRVTALVFFLLSVPVAVVSLVAYFPLKWADYSYRREGCFVDTSDRVAVKPAPALTVEEPLHIRTHNVGLVPPYMSVIGELRPPRERAHELLESVVNDPHQPDVICFQEVFDEESMELLVRGLKEVYPFVIAHVAEDRFTPLHAGTLIVSKMRIERFKHYELGHMIGPEKLSHRGISQITIKTADDRSLDIYSIHLQALIGEGRAEARYEQLKDLGEILERDRDESSDLQVVVGDTNCQELTVWGEDMVTPSGQSEEKVAQVISEQFDDLFLLDHDAKTGRRTEGEARFLHSDNRKMREELEEPRGSWYQGPFSGGFKRDWVQFKAYLDRVWHGRPAPKVDKALCEQQSEWGTRHWKHKQLANTARFDRVLVPKGSSLTGSVEIRRVATRFEAEPLSAPSDHLPVDALIALNQNSGSR